MKRVCVLYIAIGVLASVICLSASAQDKITLKSGQVITGKIINRDAKGVSIEEMVSGALVTSFIPQARIVSISIQEPPSYKKATGMEKTKEYKEAAALYRQVKTKYRGYDWAEKALFRMAACLEKVEDLSGATNALNELLKDYPQTEFTTDARLKLTEILFRQGNFKEVLSSYRGILKTLSLDEEKAGTQAKIADTLFKMERFEDSLVEYLRVVVVYFKYAALASYAKYRSGVCFEKLGKLEEARAAYEELINYFPPSEWGSKAKEKMKGGLDAK